MPKKRRRAAAARKVRLLPWLVLTVSLAIIGYACTRTPSPSSHIARHMHRAAHSAPHSVAVAPPAPVPTPAVAEPAATAGRAVTAESAAAEATTSASAPPPVASASSPAREAPAAPSPAAPEAAQPPPAGDEESGSSAEADRAGPHAPLAPPAKTSPRIALIIDDCGQWLDTERGFIALPVALTMSVLPDVRYNRTIEREAAANDKGVMLHLPMETLSGLNPGPGKVTTEMSDGAITAMVERDLDDVDLAQGVNNHEGSRATADPRVMNDVMTVLARHGRFFIDSRTNRASIAQEIAEQRGVASAARDVFIDNRADVAYSEAQLNAAAFVARRDGQAIAIGHPRPTTLAAVRAMIPRLEAEGFTFVLASSLTKVGTPQSKP